MNTTRPKPIPTGIAGARTDQVLEAIRDKAPETYSSIDALAMRRVERYLSSMSQRDIVDFVLSLYVEDCLDKNSPARDEFVSALTDLHMAAEHGDMS